MRARTVTLLAALVLAGCPRDEDTPPQNESSSGNAETTTTDTSPPTTTVEPTTTVGTEESGPIDTSAGSESTSGGEECLGPDGCWSCEPVQPEQVLNRCTDADCEPFDNSPKRLPLIGRDGSLPPIP